MEDNVAEHRLDKLNSIANRILEVSKLDAAQFVALVVGYLYLSGYLINAIALRNYGIQRFEVLKLQYIEAGLVFLVLSSVFTIIPLAAIIVHFRVRRNSPLPNYKVGAVGYAINTCNLFVLITFFAVFITNFDWNTNIRIWPFRGFRLSQVFLGYLFFAVFGLSVMPWVERLIIVKIKNVKEVYLWVVEPIRYGIVLIGIAFDVLLFTTLPWLFGLLKYGYVYFVFLLAILGGLTGIVYWIKRIGRPRNIHGLTLLGSVGVLVLSYVCINAYVFSILRFIPMNRGGKLPITRSYLASDQEVLNDLPILRQVRSEGSRWGPVYILEESDNMFYVADTDIKNWFRDWVPVIAVNKDAVTFIEHERIDDGSPRWDHDVSDKEADLARRTGESTKQD